MLPQHSVASIVTTTISVIYPSRAAVFLLTIEAFMFSKSAGFKVALGEAEAACAEGSGEPSGDGEGEAAFDAGLGIGTLAGGVCTNRFLVPKKYAPAPTITIINITIIVFGIN